MQLFVYASRSDADRDRLLSALHDDNPKQAIDLYYRLDLLEKRFHSVIEPDSILILVMADRSELLKIQTLKDLTSDIFVLMVIPDWQEETLHLAHRLLPRFLCHKADDYQDLVQVIVKMIRTPH